MIKVWFDLWWLKKQLKPLIENWLVSYREVEFIETSLIAYPCYWYTAFGGHRSGLCIADVIWYMKCTCEFPVDFVGVLFMLIIHQFTIIVGTKLNHESRLRNQFRRCWTVRNPCILGDWPGKYAQVRRLPNVINVDGVLRNPYHKPISTW